MRRSTAVIAISNQKGGVGKTTTAVSLAHDLARRGHTTALIDLDAQGNTSACLGIKPRPGLYQVFAGILGLPGGTSLADALLEARDNLWLLPGDPTTATLKTILAGYPADVLAGALSPLDVEYCIIDTGPSRDLLHQLAHIAADAVVIPAAVDHLALIGVNQEMDSLKAVRAGGHPIECAAILPTFWDPITKESEANLGILVQRFGDLVLPAIPRTTKLREAPAHGQTIWEYLSAHGRDNKTRLAYARLTERIVRDDKETD